MFKDIHPRDTPSASVDTGDLPPFDVFFIGLGWSFWLSIVCYSEDRTNRFLYIKKSKLQILKFIAQEVISILVGVDKQDTPFTR